MSNEDVLRFIHPVGLIGLTVILSAIAFSGVRGLMANPASPPETFIPEPDVELWKVH